jgi:hypothetical protein
LRVQVLGRLFGKAVSVVDIDFARQRFGDSVPIGMEDMIRSVPT